MKKVRLTRQQENSNKLRDPSLSPPHSELSLSAVTQSLSLFLFLRRPKGGGGGEVKRVCLEGENVRKRKCSGGGLNDVLHF